MDRDRLQACGGFPARAVYFSFRCPHKNLEFAVWHIHIAVGMEKLGSSRGI